MVDDIENATIFFIHKLTNEALILSARDMDYKERKSYAK